MRACIVSREYPPETGWGGIGTQAYLKAHGLSSRGHQVHVVAATWSGQARTYRDGDVVVHRILAPDLYTLGYDGPAYWLAYSSVVAKKIQELGEALQFDIFQFAEYASEGFIYQTGTFQDRRASYVVQLHGPLAMFAAHLGWPKPGSPQHRIGCFLEGTVIHHSDQVLASSCNTAEFSAGHYDYPRDRIEVIHSGIDVSHFAPRPQPREHGFPRVLFVGKLSEGKGIGVLVQAVLGLRRQYPNILLRACGKADEEVLRRLEKEIADCGAAANFDFRGNVPYRELPDHYGWCDIFAGPSVFEPGPGNVYLEAMACAKPVIACDTGGAPEVVLNGRTGVLVRRNDKDALKAAISSLADAVQLRTQLGQNGREWVLENFSIEKYTDKVERVYEAVIARAK